MYCAYLGGDHDPDECYHCPLGIMCAGIPSRLMFHARPPAQSVGNWDAGKRLSGLTPSGSSPVNRVGVVANGRRGKGRGEVNGNY